MGLFGSSVRGSRFIRTIALQLFVAGAVLTESPARAELLPRPDLIALPEEKALLNQALAKLLDDQSGDKAKHLAALDELLAKLGKPTQLRGFVQFLRANALSEQGGEFSARAREAVDESVRLLPGFSGPLLLASHIYTYSDQPGRAADYVIRASHIDAEIVSQIPHYELSAIFTRLAFHQDQRRIRALSERLLEIGWLADSLSGRSSLAFRAIQARMAEGDLAGAQALVPKLLDPAHARTLLAQRKYEALWPAIELWAGPKLENQWRFYLSEARASWQTSREPASALAYAQALEAAGHHDTIIRELLPLFSKPLDKHVDYDLIFLASKVAKALAYKGRWADIEAMYERASKAWKLGEEANALNLTGNRALHLFYSGKAAQGLALLDSAIADAEGRRPGEVNGDALTLMHHYRACMLHVLGRDDEGIMSRARAASNESPASQADLNLCLGKQEAAREILIAGLGIEDSREDIIAYLQKSDAPPMQSDYGRLIHARRKALEADPKLLAAMTRYGRILPFTLASGAPIEQVPEKEL